MIQAEHPSTLINPENTAILREHATEAEALGMLHPVQLALVHQQQWFKLLVPGAYSGLEKDLPAHIRLQEAISWADGSAGWVVTLCSGAGWFGGFIDPAVAGQVFNTPNVCLAGSGAQTGEAELLANGNYRLNGTWNYASGAYHATHFTANCLIKKNGEQVMDADKPLVLPFIIDKAAVTLLPTWKYTGMVATGSNSFHIDNVELAADRSFHIDAAYAVVNSHLYRYPFLQLAEATLAVNLSGMALHFTDLCISVFADRAKKTHITQANQQQLQMVLHDAIHALQLARDEFFTAVDASWIAPENDNEKQLKAVSKTSRALAHKSREVVDLLYPYCGLVAAAADTEINRVWRDLHTATQHSLLTFAE